jgi:hypothetical protein
MTTESRPFRDMAEARRVVADLEAQLQSKDQAMQVLAESSEFFRLLANAHWAVVESCAAEITDLEDDLMVLADALEASCEPVKPIVDLIWSFDQDEGSGIGYSYLIVAWPTGIIYTNQTNGHGCSHPSQEGILVTLLVSIDFDPWAGAAWT